MTISFKEFEMLGEGNTVYMKVTGKLEKEDYEIFVPELEDRIKKYGKLRMLMVLDDFHGWTAGACWEDTKFGIKHFNDLERFAIVGDKDWEKGLAMFIKPFTRAKVRFFDARKEGALDEAQEWVKAD